MASPNSSPHSQSAMLCRPRRTPSLLILHRPLPSLFVSSAFFLLFFLLLLTNHGTCLDLSAPPPPRVLFKEGDELDIECRQMLPSSADTWTTSHFCHLTLHAGVSSFKNCVIRISNESVFSSLKSIIEQKEALQCRVPTSQDRRRFLPFSIPLWGSAHTDFLRINDRISFIFHFSNGVILGGGAYAVSGRSLPAKVGNQVAIRTQVTWVRHESLQSAGALAGLEGPNVALRWVEDCLLALASAAFSCLLTLICAASLYLGKLKPAIIRRCSKKD